MKRKRIKTVWQLSTYDVWGNAKDGWEVNNTFSIGSIEIAIPVELNNAGTPQAFESAFPSDNQIRKVFGIRRIKISTEGDDLHIYVNRGTNDYPIGEMFCTSHESLSPIRRKLTEIEARKHFDYIPREHFDTDENYRKHNTEYLKRFSQPFNEKQCQ